MLEIWYKDNHKGLLFYPLIGVNPPGLTRSLPVREHPLLVGKILPVTSRYSPDPVQKYLKPHFHVTASLSDTQRVCVMHVCWGAMSVDGRCYVLESSGFAHVWNYPESVNVDIFVPLFHMGLKDLYICDWRIGLKCKSSLHLYREMKTIFELSDYLMSISNVKYRNIISKLRLSAIDRKRTPPECWTPS